MSAISFERHPNGPRVRVFGQRSHHGAWGCIFCIHPKTRKVGIALCLHDLHDLKKWFAGGWQD